MMDPPGVYDLQQLQAQANAQAMQASRRYPAAEEQLQRRLESVESWLADHTPEKVAEKQAEAQRIRGALECLKAT